MTSHHTTSYRIYYEDTDAAGVVYYANYLKFAERARTEMLRERGIVQSEWLAKEGIGFVVSRAEIDYKRGAKLDDEIRVETGLSQLGKVRMTMKQIIYCGDVLLAALKVDIACVNAKMKPVRIPKAIQEAVQMGVNRSA